VELENNRRLGFRCEDTEMRAKRFCAYPERMGQLRGMHTVECIHEQDARFFDTKIVVPTWVFDGKVYPDTFRAEQLAFNEAQTGLQTWEGRTDVPAWAYDLRLALTLHGMHWSGYRFNDYAQMLDIIRFAADRIDGRHVLAYLPGWEGRYYWQYGDFRPDPLLGGEEGFTRLCVAAKARSGRPLDADVRRQLRQFVVAQLSHVWSFIVYENGDPQHLSRQPAGLEHQPHAGHWRSLGE
jgi:hypothetical protein